MTTEEKLIKKIVEILADYKFNSTKIETSEMIAERIIGIVKQEMLEKFEKFIKDRTYIKEDSVIMMVRFMPFEWEDFKKKEGGA